MDSGLMSTLSPNSTVRRSARRTTVRARWKWVAAGRYDSFWERNLNSWDIAAGIVLVKEAGGFVAEIDDKPDLLETGSIVAGNEAMLAALKGKLDAAR